MSLVEGTLQDLRQAWRGFRAQPGFTAIVVATIGLGLGLNAALFTVFNHYALRPFAVRDPYGLYAVSWVDRAGGRHGFGWLDVQQLASDRSIFTDVAATRSLYSRVDGRPLVGDLVGDSYFRMLGIEAARGRTLGQDAREGPAGSDVLVLSDAAWRDWFGADSAILGKRLLVRGRPMEVIGVAQPGFDGLGDTPVQYWAPLAASLVLEPHADVFSAAHRDSFRVIGRLRPEVAPAAATVALSTWIRRMTGDLAPDARAAAAVVESKATAVHVTREMAVVFAPLVAAFGLVLGLACANVANMLLARGLSRQREIGVRLAIGASRGRIVRQLLTESLVLGLVAAFVSVGLGQLLISIAVHGMYATLPADIAPLIHTIPLRVDPRVVGVMLIAGLVATMLFGVAPALQSTRRDVTRLTRNERLGIPAARLRTLLAAGQVTLCVLLVTCAGIVLRSAEAITRFDLGFEAARVLVLRVDERVRPAVVRALDTHPGITHVAAARSTPMNGLLPSLTLSTDDGRTAIRSWHNGVSSGFFDLLHVPLVAGRTFTDDEARDGSGVTILSASAAGRLWPGQPALGRLVHIQRDTTARAGVGELAETRRVIGVARDIVSCCVTWGKDPAVVYLPLAAAAAGTSLVLGVDGDVTQIRQQVEATLDRIGPGAVDEMHPLDQYVAGGVYPFRAASWIVAALAVLALMLTVSGIYGVVSYVVSQRTRELGIRMAVGATRTAIAGLVIGQSLRMSAFGIVAGGSLVAGLGGVVGLGVPFLNFLDVPVYAAGLGTVLATALVAAAVPAWRAIRVDPVALLRRE